MPFSRWSYQSILEWQWVYLLVRLGNGTTDFVLAVQIPTALCRQLASWWTQPRDYRRLPPELVSTAPESREAQVHWLFLHQSY